MKAFIGTVILILILSSIYKKNQKKKGISSDSDQSTTSIDEIAKNVANAIGSSFYIDIFAGDANVEIDEGAIMVHYKIIDGDLEFGKSFLKAAENEIRSRAQGHQGKFQLRTLCVEFNGEAL